MTILFLLAAVLTATPATLPAQLRAAKCGNRVVLAAGDYGAVTIPRVDCANPIELDASEARMTSLVIRSTAGVEVRGGRVDGSGGGAAVTVDASRRVRVSGMVIGGARVGITVVRSTDVEVVGNRLDGVRSDGINLTMAQRVRITGNACLNFRPTPAVYDAKGKLLVDGDHPDCIQGWTTVGTAPTADITIEGNTAEGHMQGLWFGNPGTGGYDRVVIRGNDFRLSAWHGISILEGRGTVIEGNTVRTIPGAKAQSFPFQPIKVWIYAPQGGRVCGNVVPSMPGGEGTKAC